MVRETKVVAVRVPLEVHRMWSEAVGEGKKKGMKAWEVFRDMLEQYLAKEKRRAFVY